MCGEWRERDQYPTSFPASMTAVTGANGANGWTVTLALPRAQVALPARTNLAPRELGPRKTPMELTSDSMARG
jgi:hypothetical protein